MPLSSVIGAQSIVRPGVCTSSTRPASPYDGQVIYETDTDKTLVWNGSGWVMLATGTANAPGLELITTQTIGSAVSSVTVSNCFSSGFARYKITVSGGVASATMDIQMTLGSANTGYYGFLTYGSYSSNTVNGYGQNNAAFWGYVGAGTTDALHGNCEVDNPFDTKRSFVTAQTAVGVTTSAASTFSGYLNNNTSYSSFTLTASTGTMTGGTIRVYGYKN